jgi:O-antigen/teichoic acid export membrane protein
MDKTNNLVKSIFVLGIGTILSRMMIFILLPLYTLYLSPSEYGTYDLVVSYVMSLAPLLTIQLEWSAFRYLIDARGDEKEKGRVISNITILIIGLSFAYLLLSYLLNIFVRAPYFEFILCLSFSVIFSSVSLQFARGLGDNKKFAIAGVFNGVTTLFTVLLLIAYAGWGIEGALLGTTLANVITGAYLFFSLGLYRYVKISNANIGLQRNLLKYSIPLVPDGLSWWVVNASDRTIITIMIGAAANGIYAVANKYAMIFGVLFSVFNMSWNESASVHINDVDRDRFFSKTSSAIVRMFGSLALLMIAFLPIVFNLLIDRRYAESYNYIPILVLGAFFHAIAGLYSSVYIAKKLTKQIAKTTILAAVINIIINLTLISFLGIYAAAISTAVAYLFLAVYRHYDVKKYVSIEYENHIFSSLALLFTMVISLYYLNNLVTNVANVMIAAALAILLNRSTINMIKTKLFTRLHPLTPEQQVMEEIVEKQL